MQEQKPETKSTMKKVLAYSGMGIQMMVTILLFVWLGTYLDGDKEGVRVYTLVCTLVGIVAAFYFLIKAFLRQ